MAFTTELPPDTLDDSSPRRVWDHITASTSRTRMAHHPRRSQPRTSRMHLRTGFLIFAIDELDKLRGTYTREHEFLRGRWRLRRLGFGGAEGGLTLNFGVISQQWLREVIKKFLRWRVDIGHSASGMHRDLTTLTRMADALTEHAGPDARPDQFTRDVITRFLTLLAEDGLTATGRSRKSQLSETISGHRAPT